MGLTYFKRYRMEIDLSRPFPALPELPPGYRACGWDESLLESHAWAKYRSFCQEIDAFIFPSLGDAEGCRGLMCEIARREEFLGEATWLLVYQPVACEPPESCGTIQGLRTGALAGSLQNVGVVPGHRGRGLGSYLMGRSLAGFRSAGIRRVTLEVTARNRAAQRLYRRLAFRRVRTVYKAVQVASSGVPR
jgi:GNAT superfamily N-acetyltransferase